MKVGLPFTISIGGSAPMKVGLIPLVLGGLHPYVRPGINAGCGRGGWARTAYRCAYADLRSQSHTPCTLALTGRLRYVLFSN